MEAINLYYSEKEFSIFLFFYPSYKNLILLLRYAGRKYGGWEVKDGGK
jgi:hypothetical protein